MEEENHGWPKKRDESKEGKATSFRAGSDDQPMLTKRNRGLKSSIVSSRKVAERKDAQGLPIQPPVASSAVLP